MARSRSVEERFFDLIRPQVREAFESSDIRPVQERLRRPGRPEGHWYYQLIAVPLVREAPVLLGLNWAVAPGTIHHPQTSYRDVSGYGEIMSWGFPGMFRHQIDRHLGRRWNYFNVCPFRSPSWDEISDEDRTLGITSFLRPTLEFLKPSWVLMAGKGGLDCLERAGLVAEVTAEMIRVPAYNKRISIAVARLNVGDLRAPVPCVGRPHDLHLDESMDALWAAATAKTPA